MKSVERKDLVFLFFVEKGKKERKNRKKSFMVLDPLFNR